MTEEQLRTKNIDQHPVAVVQQEQQGSAVVRIHRNSGERLAAVTSTLGAVAGGGGDCAEADAEEAPVSGMSVNSFGFALGFGLFIVKFVQGQKAIATE